MIIMKKIITSVILCLTIVAASAQKYCTLDDIRDGWRSKTIKGVKSGNILPLMTAFNQTWRTAPATALLKEGTIPSRQDEEYHYVVDTPNGYVSAAELGDDGESISACVWKRTNGHKLFAVVVTKYHGVFPETQAFFYDYNPNSSTLTPETNEVTEFKPAVTTSACLDAVSIKLPQHGKSVEIEEYIMGWGSSIRHIFEWTGMGPKWSHVNIDNYDKMQNLYIVGEPNFYKYALIDIDEDDIPELWLISENEDNQAIYSLANGEVSVLASKYYKNNFTFFNKGANTCILTAGGCGTGCFFAEYAVINQSKVKYRLNDMQSWNYQKDEMVSEYTLDEKAISNTEAERIIKSFGQPVEIKPTTKRLSAK